MKRLPQLLACLAWIFAACLLASPVEAKTLTWAADADINSLDPHARDETFTLGFLNNVYEGLVARGPKMEILPALAVKWEIAEPKRWRVYLRRGVKFAEGEPFTADDVIFSVKRSLSPGSGMKRLQVAVCDRRGEGGRLYGRFPALSPEPHSHLVLG